MLAEYRGKAPRPQNQTSVFVKRKRTFTLAVLGVMAIFSMSSVVTHYDVVDGLESIPKAALWIAENLIPDARAWSRLPNILKKLTENGLTREMTDLILLRKRHKNSGSYYK